VLEFRQQAIMLSKTDLSIAGELKFGLVVDVQPVQDLMGTLLALPKNVRLRGRRFEAIRQTKDEALDL